MNYILAYKNLIDRARSRVLEGYAERHHIVPRCLKGTDDPSNIVSLTPEEHYLAHLLLVKIHPHSRGLLYAVKLMSGQGNNKSYGWVKRKLSKTGFTSEHRKAMSESQKARAKIAPKRSIEDTKKLWAKNDKIRQKKADSAIITALIYSLT